jgi:excisionase family DNA binding protein
MRSWAQVIRGAQHSRAGEEIFDPLEFDVLRALGVRPSVRIKTAAAMMDTDESTVRALVDQGELEGHRVGIRGVRVYVDSIKAYQERNKIGGTRHGLPSAGQTGRPCSTRQPTSHQESLAHLVELGLVTR